MKKRSQWGRWLVTGTLAIAAQACAFDGVFVFGDSLSDTGNNAIRLGIVADQPIDNTWIPTYPYESGRYSNGEVWTVSFAQALGLGVTPSLAGGNAYAYGGARTGIVSPDGAPPLRDQVASYLALKGGLADPDALYVLAGGGNNARDTLEAIAGGAPFIKTLFSGTRSYVADVGFMVDQLQAAGAQHIVVWNTPDIAKAPAVMAETGGSFLAGIVVKSMNRALDKRLAHEAGVTTFDVFGLFDGVIANPGPYGLLNVTDACGGIPGCDPSTYLFWDGIHPTSAGQKIIADAMIAQVGTVPEPETVWLFSFGGLAMLLLRRRFTR
jgi:outer membrane lipase/esterase